MSDDFAPRLLRWFDAHGRHDLPWQHPRTPYRVWLSEIMLQQTQVATVVPYFLRFVEKLQSIKELAAASEDEVFSLWSGLGYYSRARNLHRAARICNDIHGGDLPDDFDALIALPGIGRSTAGAILAQAYGRRRAILDGNVKRVLARFHGVAGWPGEKATENRLWQFAEAHTPSERVADYTQAIMDLGAGVCARAKPRCGNCPLHPDCAAYRDGLTAALPARKPAKARPTRSTVMLVLRDTQGRLLLERRGPSGVWAGLWSLPEAASETAARDAVAHIRRLDADAIVFSALPPFVHGFSHYQLDVTPLAFDVEFAHAVGDGDDRRWLHPHEAAALGLPAPVRKLIESLPRHRSEGAPSDSR
ncbi:MAG: A/G-specific adenine glycosylase [Rudaea sp.]|uniref:A/G-specific adenine glycosylase n=1 Tax=unclassified Rudaea TaxID=2627037 RepID=UPI0010FA3252|nr:MULTISPECIES: A/G-specific adenine glycosylase [unclassified Rudaea]MBN8885825.1 A/G-specific adenine glycosylase [Rudaea sp.]MBR0344159.1 A/G-specific adenine glycosylase [Rudaea sp.]